MGYRARKSGAVGPTREDSKVVSQGELCKLWNQDSNPPCWASLSLSLAFCLPSWQFLPSSLSFFLRFCLSFLLLYLALSFPFCHTLIPFCLSSLTLSVSVFILLPSFPFLRHSISLSYFLLLSVLFALQLFSFLSLTFFCFLSLPLFSYSLPPCSLSPFLFVLLLLSSLSVALPNVFPGPPLSPGDPGELV